MENHEANAAEQSLPPRTALAALKRENARQRCYIMQLEAIVRIVAPPWYKLDEGVGR